MENESTPPRLARAWNLFQAAKRTIVIGVPALVSTYVVLKAWRAVSLMHDAKIHLRRAEYDEALKKYDAALALPPDEIQLLSDDDTVKSLSLIDFVEPVALGGKAEVFRRTYRDREAEDLLKQADWCFKRVSPLFSTFIDHLVQMRPGWFDNVSFVRQFFDVKIQYANLQHLKPQNPTSARFLQFVERFRHSSESHISVELFSRAARIARFQFQAEPKVTRKSKVDSLALEMLRAYPAYSGAKSRKPTEIRPGPDGCLSTVDRDRILAFLSDKSISYSERTRANALINLCVAWEDCASPEALVAAAAEAERARKWLTTFEPNEIPPMRYARLWRFWLLIKRGQHGSERLVVNNQLLDEIKELQGDFLRDKDMRRAAEAAFAISQIYKARQEWDMASAACEDAIRLDPEHDSRNWTEYHLERAYANLHLKFRAPSNVKNSIALAPDELRRAYDSILIAKHVVSDRFPGDESFNIALQELNQVYDMLAIKQQSKTHPPSPSTHQASKCCIL